MEQRVGCLAVPALALVVGVFSLALEWVMPNCGMALLVAFGAVMVYSIVAPLIVLVARSAWLSGLAVAPIWLALMAVLMGAAESFCKHPIGDDAMVLLLPMMICPSLLAVVSIIRLIQWFQRRGREAGGGASESRSSEASDA
jgi:hypothetical protein